MSQHSTAAVMRRGNVVVKTVQHYLEYDVFSREVGFLKMLQHSGFTPDCLDVDYQRHSFSMTWCGEELNRTNIPVDAERQMATILNTLREVGDIRHNDIRPGNITVLSRRLYLIDWQWATQSVQPPAHWPAGLGSKFRAGWPKWLFSDRISAEKVLESCR